MPDLSKRIKIAIVGTGNCASSLVQGIFYYSDSEPDDQIPGIMHVMIGDYHLSSIEVVAAFDIDADKVGKDLGKALFSGQNNTVKFAHVPDLGVTVQRGPTLDGYGIYLNERIKQSDAPVVNVAEVLKESGAEIVVNYLPVGSEEAARYYAQAALDAGCAFVNAMPTFIATDPEWDLKFAEAGLPILGDDVKSQVGATILHRTLVNLFNARGVKIERTSQLNVGGNTDFLNMLERKRLETKKKSKTQAVTSQIPYEMEDKNVHIGPSDYVEWLDDRKWAFITIEGTTFGDVPLKVELKAEVVDSPNSAGIIIDAIRCAKIALDRHLAGAIEAPSSYFFKSPPIQPEDTESRRMLEAFISGEDYVWKGLERTRGTVSRHYKQLPLPI